MTKNKRNKNSAYSFFLAVILPVLLSSFFGPIPARSASETITATVAVGICGNNIVEYGEDCDGSALDGQTCESLGYDAGTLTCGIGCDFDESECVNLGPGEGSVVFPGKAYPSSVIKILKDGQVAATTAADSSGNFETTLSHLIVGSYSFAIYGYDSNGHKSKTLSFRRHVSKNEIQTIDNIIMPPTLETNKDEIKKGDKIIFSGQSVPQAHVDIHMTSGDESRTFDATAGNNGYYRYKLDTEDYDPGNYTLKAKTNIDGISSEYGEEIEFEITEETVPANSSANRRRRIDLNDDARVNLIDFSIFIQWLGKSNPPSNVDVNGDRIIDLSDFSIMMYYWTG